MRWPNGWRVEVSNDHLRWLGRDRCLVPSGLDLAYQYWDRDASVFMPPMIAQIARVWFRYHRHPWRFGFWLGVLDTPMDRRIAGMYVHARWRWDFWNGSRSWHAERVVARHGFAAYRARYEPQSLALTDDEKIVYGLTDAGLWQS